MTHTQARQVEPIAPRSTRRAQYALHHPLSEGSVTSVHLGVLAGVVDAPMPVAVKRLRDEAARDATLRIDLAREVRLLAQIRHPNVVSAVEFVEATGESIIVMEYVLGSTLANVLLLGGRCPVAIAVAILADTLHGLHAAHTAVSAEGAPLGIVHADVCPDNILIGTDGIARIIDFGSALTHDTTMGMPSSYRIRKNGAPEQILGRSVDFRADIFTAAVVLWYALTGKRPPRDPALRGTTWEQVSPSLPPASAFNCQVPRVLDRIIARALARSPGDRFDSAAQFAIALEASVARATPREVADYLEHVDAGRLAFQRALMESIGFAESHDHRELAREMEPVDAPLPTPETACDEPTLVWLAPSTAGARRCRLPPRQMPLLMAGVLMAFGGLLALTLLFHTSTATARLSAPVPVEPPVLVRPGAAPALPVDPVPEKGAAHPPAASISTPPPLREHASDGDVSPRIESVRARARRPAHGRTPPASSLNCSPPYRVDAKGIRRLRLKCL